MSEAMHTELLRSLLSTLKWFAIVQVVIGIALLVLGTRAGSIESAFEAGAGVALMFVGALTLAFVAQNHLLHKVVEAVKG